MRCSEMQGYKGGARSAGSQSGLAEPPAGATELPAGQSAGCVHMPPFNPSFSAALMQTTLHSPAPE